MRSRNCSHPLRRHSALATSATASGVASGMKIARESFRTARHHDWQRPDLEHRREPGRITGPCVPSRSSSLSSRPFSPLPSWPAPSFSPCCSSVPYSSLVLLPWVASARRVFAANRFHDREWSPAKPGHRYSCSHSTTEGELAPSILAGYAAFSGSIGICGFDRAFANARKPTLANNRCY